MATRIQVVIDCADPDGLAGFWAQALGYHKQDPPQGYASWPAFETAQGVPRTGCTPGMRWSTPTVPVLVSTSIGCLRRRWGRTGCTWT
jgi:hypothetical protein